MGLTRSIYLDSCLAIYLVEENPNFVTTLESALAANSDAIICVSPLTELECLVMPLRLQNNALITKFEEWFGRVTVFPMDVLVYRHAAKLRADFSPLRTPDALHLATAQHYGCDELWTNDNRLNAIDASLVKNILTA